MLRRTVVVGDRLALASARLEFARSGRGCGVNAWPVEWLAQRLAGGFLTCIQADEASAAVTEALGELSDGDLGDLAGIRRLPGLRRSLVASLRRAWAAGLDLDAASGHPRIAVMAAMEREVLARLPPGRLRPADLVARALERLPRAASAIGPVEFRHLPDLDPVWRPLVTALREHVPVTWNAGSFPTPRWVETSGIEVVQLPAASPERLTYSCAGPRHEVIEALRWARGLVASGRAGVEEIGIAAASTTAYDDMMATLAEEASLPLHFAHGLPALLTPGGQGAAALADILLRGLTQDRVRRLVARIRAQGTPLEALPEGWWRELKSDATLSTPERWRLALAHGTGAPVAAALLPAIDLLARGADAAEEAGEALLRGPSRTLWRRALLRADAGALERELSALRVPDGVEPAAAIAWMPASALASSPRKWTWLLGLNARSWPRPDVEDPLLPDHVLGPLAPEETSIPKRDRRSFAAIEASTTHQVVRSFSRREPGGRRLGVSPLVNARDAVPLLRTRIPQHAMSAPDRLLARPEEFAATPSARAARSCWLAWRSGDLTAHDGLVLRPDHPAILRALDRVQSASSLSLLIRNPIGFTWRYALGLRSPEADREPLALDARALGDLVHDILEAATVRLGQDALGALDAAHAAEAVDAVLPAIAARWEAERAVPPGMMWERARMQARALAVAALAHPFAGLPGQSSYAEVPFGGVDGAVGGRRLGGDATRARPWDPATEVRLPGTGMRIGGVVDRVDLSGDRSNVRVVDYKTGRRREGVQLRGGRELQRCLYAAAVRSLVPGAPEVQAGLLHPSEGAFDILHEPDAALDRLSGALACASANLRRGLSLPGIAAGGAGRGPKELNADGEYDDYAFALPVVPGTTLGLKKGLAAARLGPVADFWREP